ncbi:hypothetical protein Tco_0506469 [Tanacetum coccineum]
MRGKDEKKRLDLLKQDQEMLVIKIFNERKKVFREIKKCEKIRAKRSDFLQGMKQSFIRGGNLQRSLAAVTGKVVSGVENGISIRIVVAREEKMSSIANTLEESREEGRVGPVSRLERFIRSSRESVKPRAMSRGRLEERSDRRERGQL